MRALLFLPLLVGCSAGIDLGRATALAAGETRYSAGFETSYLTVSLQPGEATPAPWGALETGVHHGFGHNLELGARAWGFGFPWLVNTLGVAGDAKLQVVHGPGPDVALALSLAYHRAALGGTPTHVGEVTVPVLVGFDVGRSQLVVSPRFRAGVIGSVGQVPITLGAGGVGLAWYLPVRRVELAPEVIVTYSPIALDGEVKAADKRGGWEIELGGAVSFGRRKQ